MMLRSVRVKIRLVLKSPEDTSILDVSLRPENDYAPPNIKINQTRMNGTLDFLVRLLDENLLTLARTVDDFLFSACLVIRLLRSLSLKQNYFKCSKNGSKYK